MAQILWLCVVVPWIALNMYQVLLAFTVFSGFPQHVKGSPAGDISSLQLRFRQGASECSNPTHTTRLSGWIWFRQSPHSIAQTPDTRRCNTPAAPRITVVGAKLCQRPAKACAFRRPFLAPQLQNKPPCPTPATVGATLAFRQLGALSPYPIALAPSRSLSAGSEENHTLH